MKLQTWQQVSSLGKSTLIRTSFVWLFLIPIAAKIMRPFVGTPMKIAFIEEPITIHFPVGWVAFYIMSALFAAAQLVYFLRCPEVVSRFSSHKELASDHMHKSVREPLLETLVSTWTTTEIAQCHRMMVRSGTLDSTVRDTIRDESINLKGKEAKYLDDMERSGRLTDPTALVAAVVDRNNHEDAALQVMYWMAQQCRRRSLLLCGSLFLAGGLSFAWAAGQNFWTVMSIAFASAECPL